MCGELSSVVKELLRKSDIDFSGINSEGYNYIKFGKYIFVNDSFISYMNYLIFHKDHL